MILNYLSGHRSFLNDVYVFNDLVFSVVVVVVVVVKKSYSSYIGRHVELCCNSDVLSCMPLSYVTTLEKCRKASRIYK